jgi:hypothetical protein
MRLRDGVFARHAAAELGKVRRELRTVIDAVVGIYEYSQGVR